MPRVNLRWEIDERNPAIINRIEITGNDYTTEGCIRDALVIIPGDVFSQDRLIRSYQNLGNLGFFDSPIPQPDMRPSGDSGGDVDLVFHLKEKHTGNVNFGASTGQGTGLGGFIGFDQPNLFGECKKGSIQWQFGRYINNADPLVHGPVDPGVPDLGDALGLQHRIAIYHWRSGPEHASRGQRAGGYPGGPIAVYARLRVVHPGGRPLQRRYDDTPWQFGGPMPRVRPIGARPLHPTRYAGGAPLRGTGRAPDDPVRGQRRPAGRGRHVPAGWSPNSGVIRPWRRSAAAGLGSEPMALVLGFKARGGAVFGNSGPFFASEAFAMGGTQYGEQLRGYKEFSIGPSGYLRDDRGVQRDHGVLWQRLYDHNDGDGASGQQLPLRRHIFRCWKRVCFGSGLRPSPAVPWGGRRGGHCDPVGTLGPRLRVRVRQGQCCRQARPRVGAALQARQHILTECPGLLPEPVRACAALSYLMITHVESKCG